MITSLLYLRPRILVTDDLVFSTSSDRTARVWYNDHEEHPKALIRTLKVIYLNQLVEY